MLKLLIFLSILGILKESIAHEAEKPCNCENVLGSFAYDDTLLRNLGHQVQLLNDNLRLRMDVLTTRLDQQTEIIKDLSAKLSTYSSESAAKDRVILDTSAPLVVLQGAFADTTTETRNANNKTYAVQHRLPANCAEATAETHKSGLYTIQVNSVSLNQKPFLASCDEETQDGGWTVIQRRMDGSIDFYRNWAEYKKGFGNLEGEFFIGMDRLHALTTDTPQELLIVMEDFDHGKKFAKYDAFAIGDEDEAYALKVLGQYSGDAGDSLRGHVSHKWTTKDVDNDSNNDSPTANCAVLYTGAWWYTKCHASNLNGQYLRGPYPQEQYAKGVVWQAFRGYNYALKNVKMLIRPQRK